MNGEVNKNTAIVGAFILVGLLIFVATLLLVGSQVSFLSKTVIISARFPNVNGLLKGNNVWYSGVKVGTVKGLRLNPNGDVSVEMRIENESVPYIHKDATAKIGSDGLVGNRIVVIEGGSPNKPVIQAGDVLKVSIPLSNEEILSTLQKNNENLVEITHNLKVISRDALAGRGTVGKLLTDDKLIKDVQTTVDILRQASLHANSLTRNLSNYAASLKTKGAFSNDLVTDTVVFGKLRGAVGQIQQVSLNAAKAVENIHQVTNKMNDQNNALGVLLSDTVVAQSLRSSIKNLESSSKKLDEVMDALQHNFLLRGYFRRKNR